MSDDRWQRVKEIFEAALDRSGRLREALLDAECAGDDELRAEVESLLDAAPDDSAFLESGPSIPVSVALPTAAGGRETVASNDGASDDARGRTLPRRCPLCAARYDARRRICAADGSVLEEDVESLVGTTLDGRYLIEAVLGRGGMGIVLRARHSSLDDVVAIKLLDDRHASDPSALRRFVREGQIARRFHHPAVVGIHDLVCGDTGPVYLVLEYVEGRTLGALLAERGQMPPGDAVDLVRPIAEALDAAHARGIVHRDLKPENIMVRDAAASPRTKLLDLGIAISRATAEHAADTRLTRQGYWIGTPLYMSPEQWNASTESGLDGRADVYALAVVVYQLVAGTTPFLGDIGTLRTLHLEARARRLDAAVAGVSTAFADAVARAMAKKPGDRFATAGVFVAALENALTDVADDASRRTLAGAETAIGYADAGARTLNDSAAVTGESERTPGNLPAQATSFVAPAGAVDRVAQAFATARAVTLTGPGGVGKTRLSLEAAARLDELFQGGSWFVELSAIADPSLAVRCVASTLGARERPGEPLSASIHECIGHSRLLVVLDNCEHVVDAVAEIASDLLRACPRAAVLATSREALAIPGEHVIAVEPLAIPAENASESELRASAAVQLFLDRARASTPAFAPSAEDLASVAAICRRLDGLPLAIELAAARVRAFGLGEVLRRLDDRFRLLSVSERGRESRQRTLHATIGWSVRMLGDAERALLQRLSVFASGAALDALERVCSEVGGERGGDRAAVGDRLESLVAKSLVVADLEREPVRYRMLESIRAFALEELDASGERARTEAAVDEWVLDLAGAVGESRLTPDQSAMQERMLAELDTVRQSFDRLARRGDGGEALLRAAGSLGAFFESVGMLTEGRHWLDGGIEAGTSQPGRGLALYWSGVLAIDQGDYATGGDRLESALAHCRERSDPAGTARSLRALAYLAMRRNEESRAVELATEAAAEYREIGDTVGEIASTHLMATVALGRGDYGTARPLLESTEAFHRKLGDMRSLAIDCYGLAETLAGLGEFECAERYAAESVEIAGRLGDTQTLAYATHASGWVAAARRDAVASLEAFKRALELLQSVDDDAASIYAVEGIATALAIAAGESGAPDRAVALAERSAMLAGAALAERRARDQPLSAHEQSILDQRLEAARDALGDDRIAAAAGKGEALAIGEAIQRALGESIE